MPVVSVIMLTYNRESLLPESISSVLNQDFKELELLIFDDGSTDNSKRLIEEYGDPRIRYFQLDHTGYASRMRNFAIRQAKGEFVAILDSDDLWLSEKLQRQVSALQKNPLLGFSFTNVAEFGKGNGLRTNIYPKLTTETFQGNIFNLYVQNKMVIYPSTVLFRKSCLEKTGYLNESFPWTDNDLFHRLAFFYEAHIINQPLVKIRKHDGNTSSSLSLVMADEMLHVLQSFHQEGKISNLVHKNMMAHYHYLIGMLHLRSSSKSEARKSFINCLKYKPLHIKAWIRSGLSYLGQ